jgi:hypothetical protein
VSVQLRRWDADTCSHIGRAYILLADGSRHELDLADLTITDGGIQFVVDRARFSHTTVSMAWTQVKELLIEPNAKAREQRV